MTKKKKNDRGTPRLYKFEAHFGRMGDVSSLFVAGENEIKAALGREACFGEILGKHSEISCVLAAEHFKALDTDAAFVAKFEELGCASGHNPLHYLDVD